MLTLGPGATGDKLAAKQDAGTDVVYEVCGDLRTIAGAADAYGSLAQGALAAAAAALVGPAAGTDMLISNISVFNTGASTRVVTFYKTKNSVTYDATTQWAVLRLGPGERAEWNGGWLVYDNYGVVKSATASQGTVVTNGSATSNGYPAADTYMSGTNLLLPTGLIRGGGGTFMHWIFDVVKTAAGTAAPSVIVRMGVGAALSDAARLTFAFSVQTAVIDRAIIEVWANFRSVGSGSAAVLNGIARLHHQLAVTGLNTVQPAGMQTLAVTSAGFDSTPANSYVGLSLVPNTSAVWTVSNVQSRAYM